MDNVAAIDAEIARLQRHNSVRPNDMRLTMQIAHLQLKRRQARDWRDTGLCQACGCHVFYCLDDGLKCAYCRPPTTDDVDGWFVVST